jgi:hypothetical protein
MRFCEGVALQSAALFCFQAAQSTDSATPLEKLKR